MVPGGKKRKTEYIWGEKKRKIAKDEITRSLNKLRSLTAKCQVFGR